MRLMVSALALAIAAGFGALAQHEHPTAMPGDKLGTVRFENTCSPSVQADFTRAVALLPPSSSGRRRGVQRRARARLVVRDGELGHRVVLGQSVRRRQVGAGGWSGAPLPRRACPQARRPARARLCGGGRRSCSRTSRPCRTRSGARHARAMEGVQRDYPQDIEARIFYALAVSQTAVPTDKTYAAQLKAAGILGALAAMPRSSQAALPSFTPTPIIRPWHKALDAAPPARDRAGCAARAAHAIAHVHARGLLEESAETNFASNRRR